MVTNEHFSGQGFSKSKVFILHIHYQDVSFYLYA